MNCFEYRVVEVEASKEWQSRRQVRIGVKWEKNGSQGVQLKE
jgi:hypothetical protein